MHVRSLLPQLLDSLGYTVRPSEKPGLDCIAERDGHVYGVVLRTGEITGADAVDLRLLALSHDLIPLLVAPDGLAPDGARWAEGFGIPVLGPMAIHTFAAAIEAEEESLAAERAWALEHAVPQPAPAWMDPGLPSDWIFPVPGTVVAEVAIAPGAEFAPEIPVSLLPPAPPVAPDPYRIEGLLILRKAELVDRVRARLETAAAALAALPFPEPVFAPVALLPPPPEVYGIDGLWVAAAIERLPAQAPQPEVGHVLAEMPWPVPAAARPPVAWPEPAAGLLAQMPWPAQPAPEPAADLLAQMPWPVLAPERAADVLAPMPAEAPLPWAATPTAPPAPEEPVTVPGLPWVDVDARLPWDASTKSPAATDLLRQSRDAAAAARRLGSFLPPVSQDHLVAKADPSVWGTRGRLDEIRARLNARNVQMSVEGVESDWLKGIVEDPVEDR